MPATFTEPTSASTSAGFLFIGELARETGSDPKTIRFYERAELLSPPRHGRFRTYMAQDVQRLKNVLALRRMGLPIAQIRQLFTVLDPGSDIFKDGRAIAVLRSHVETLTTRAAEVSEQLQQTEEAVSRFAG